jgi:hypothetical protein
VLFRNSCHCILKALISYNTGAGLIPCPRSPTKCLKGSISKKKNPTPEKGIKVVEALCSSGNKED